MIPELGQLSLVFALVLSGWLALHQPLSRALHLPVLLACARPLAVAIGLFITTAFICLMISYARSDFTVLNVIYNSHSLKPLWYKITGTWGNHEGSMLLWVWVLGFFGLILALVTRKSDAHLHRDALAVLGIILTGFLVFILLTSNPFVRVFPPPANGEDLNPLLQDIGLIIHPPLLYLGYVGSGIVFAYAAAAMWRRELNADFAKTIQPWLLATWAALSAGIAVGSWWAYRELGWGGWWYWDPVENVSLMPWLCGTALLHANIALEKRGHFARAVALLSILTFSMSLTGTFIVRSGLITSVHAFASDPDRGMFMLGFIALVILMGLTLYARMTWPKATVRYDLLSRQGYMLFAIIIMLTLTATILLAILYPLIMTLAGLPSISVGPPYFHAVFVPLVFPLAVLAACAPLTPWDHFLAARLRSMAVWFLVPLLVAGAAAYAIMHTADAVTYIAVAMAAGLAVSVGRFFLMQRGFALSLRNVATIIGHGGFALLLIVVAINAQYRTHIEAPLHVGESKTLDGITLSLREVTFGAKDNYFSRRAHITISQDGATLAELAPETRYYPVRAQETAESAVYSTWAQDLYAVIGRADYAISAQDAHMPSAAKQLVGVRVYIMPAQRLIWLSFTLITLSGIVGAIGHLRRKP